MSKSCSVCYNEFSNEDKNTTARKMLCQHVICYSCMSSELIDGVFYCPECGVDYHGATIEDISIEAVVGTCPCCYENFSNEDQNTMARKLPCTHIICYGCIERDLIDEVYYCPECGFENHGEDVSDFTVNAEGASTTISNDIPVSVFANSTFEETKTIHFNRASQVRTPCKFPDCNNKSLFPSNFCLAHSDEKKITNNRSSLKLIQSITKNLQSNKLMVASTSNGHLQSLDQIKVINPNDLKEKFRKQERLVLGEAMELIDNTKTIIFKEPNILRLDAPIVVVGDIHGQYYDLLNLLEEGGDPKDTQYLFLGDYVDRGNFSCEVMFLLCILKIFYPNNIYLLRGNHECASVSGHFGFKKECKMKYGLNIYYKFCLLFQSMPLGAVVSTAYGDMFACHGGLSPNLKTLDDIEKLDRFIEPESNLNLLDILWSDPIREEKIEDMNDKEFESFMDIDFHSNPVRGCSYIFGYKALKEFLKTNHLVCLIRAHEVQEDGFKKHFDPAILEAHMKTLLLNKSIEVNSNEAESYSSKENDFPPLITIFSAPNYCDRYENKGAILKIDMALDDFRIIQYDCVEHPEPEILDSESDNHISTIISLCPYMPTSFPNFIRLAVELGPENLLELETDATLEEEEQEEENDIYVTPLFKSNSIDSNRRESKSNRRESVQISLLRSKSYDIKHVELLHNDKNSDDHDHAMEPKIGNAAARWAEAIDKSKNKNKIKGVETLKRRVSQLGFQRNSDVYVHSMASDAINELHPESFNMNKDSINGDNKLEELKSLQNNVNKVSVRDLMKRFENNSISINNKNIDDIKNNSPMDTRQQGPSVSDLQKQFGGAGNFRRSSLKQVVDVDNKTISGRRVSISENTFYGSTTSLSPISKSMNECINLEPLDNKIKELPIIESVVSVEQIEPIKPRRKSSAAAALFGTIEVEEIIEPPKKENNNDINNEINSNENNIIPEKESVLFQESEILALRLMFSILNKSGGEFIEYSDLVAYAEETGDTSGIRDAEFALEILDIDGDEKIGLTDFFNYAARLKAVYLKSGKKMH